MVFVNRLDVSIKSRLNQYWQYVCANSIERQQFQVTTTVIVVLVLCVKWLGGGVVVWESSVVCEGSVGAVVEREMSGSRVGSVAGCSLNKWQFDKTTHPTQPPHSPY